MRLREKVVNDAVVVHGPSNQSNSCNSSCHNTNSSKSTNTDSNDHNTTTIGTMTRDDDHISTSKNTSSTSSISRSGNYNTTGNSCSNTRATARDAYRIDRNTTRLLITSSMTAPVTAATTTQSLEPTGDISKGLNITSTLVWGHIRSARTAFKQGLYNHWSSFSIVER